MDNLNPQREQWGSRIGFLLAAAGSAIGLGNLWRFPYLTGKNGGAAFLFIYLIILVVIGFSLTLAELSIGRHTQRNALGAFRKLDKRWGFVGAMGIIAAFVILSFYSVIGGWTISYMIKSLTGAFTGDTAEVFTSLISNPWEPIVYHGIFMLITAAIVYAGIGNGIEKASKVMMPALFILLLIVVVRSVTLEGASKGLEFYLKPDWSQVTGSTILAAMGQVFFSLSLGMGIMVTYGSYLNREENLPKSAVVIPLLDTLAAFLAGLAIMPAVFAFGLDPGEGPALMFITLPSVFAQMPLGSFFGFVFFALVFLAGLTSSMSLLEVCSSYVIDEWNWPRNKATIILAIAVFALGVPSSLSQGAVDITIFGKSFLDAVDFLASNILLPAGGLLIAIFCGWNWGIKNAVKEISNNGKLDFKLAPIWGIIIKFIAPIAIFIVFLNATGVLKMILGN
ncbi:MAG: sodium-dependent transporter [Clostridia bacterium]|nr:sodium-dependent transporter [Clostridia bacterium]